MRPTIRPLWYESYQDDEVRSSRSDLEECVEGLLGIAPPKDLLPDQSKRATHSTSVDHPNITHILIAHEDVKQPQHEEIT